MWHCRLFPEKSLKPKKKIKNVLPIFEKIEMFNFFLCDLPLILKVNLKWKQTEWRYLQGGLDIEFEWNWSDGLCAPLGDGHTQEFNFFSFRDFFRKSRQCHIVGFRMYYNPTKFDQIRGSYFWENRNFKFFLMWTTLILGVTRKRKEQAKDIYKGSPDIEFEQDWSVALGAILADGQKIKNYFSSFRDFFGKSP